MPSVSQSTSSPLRDAEGGVAAPGFLLVVPWELDRPGGVTQVVTNLQRDLLASRVAPSLLITDWSAPTPRIESDGASTIVRWRLRSPWGRGNRAWSALSFALTFPRTARTWTGLARRYNWRIVNPHYPDLDALTWLALKRFRLWRGTVIVSIHGGELRDAALGNRIERALMRRVLTGADAVVTPSAELAEEVSVFAPRTRGRVHVIANGVNADRLRAGADTSYELPSVLSGRRFILNIATFEEKKSQDVLLDAFARLATEHADVHLVLVGRATRWIETIRRRVAETAVGERVHLFVDVPHERIPAFLRHASVFCLPSRLEGHPIAILEAATFGLPVVATPVGGVPDTIRSEENGLLVPVDDAAALSAAIGRVLTDESLARRLGASLQQHVCTRFSSAAAAERYAELAHRLDQSVQRSR